MKIFQLIHWLTKLFKLNNRSKIILLILLPLPIFSQNNAAFWLGKRASSAPTNLLLDDYPGAAAAYSVRKLDKDYTGFAMEIRRASDNTTQNIGFVGENLDEAAINSFCSGTTCYVRTWYDQSGNGYNATATVVNQPVIYTAGSVITEGGKPAMDFDGSNDHFNISNNVMPLNEFYYSEIFNGIGTGLARSYNWGAFYSYKASSTLKHQNNIGVSGSTEASVFSSNSYNGRTLKTVLYNKINLTLAVNSTDLNLTVANFTILYNANDAPTIGALKNTSGNVAALLNGNLQELIIYHSDQSTNRASIESNINSYYSIY